jgi:chaperonin GroEL (HSP60 family)
MVADGMRNIAAGASTIDLKRGLDRGAKVAIEALKAQSHQVESAREKQQVATVSAHNDSTIDAAVGRCVDLAEAGIIDPTKVVRLALENAVSVAGVLLLTEATMTEVPDKHEEGSAHEAA